ncbi:MAG: PA0069 family radical SAM protein [Gammaproteobacteria bacterium]|nr:PA0069 family radical SAM protein [Gammaproteobacteria bacterium]
MGSQVRKGRGALSNQDARYQSFVRISVDNGWDDPQPGPDKLPTKVTEDQSRSVIARNTSPDVPFEQSINPYRGCEHGCIYCFARPTHAYLGLSPGLDFETRIMAKPDAPGLLAKELSRPDYRCSIIAMGTNTDPYQPVERQYRITRGILEVLSRCNHPVGITTKSTMIERDIDILAPMAARGLAHACISVTTLDSDLSRRMEPRAAAPRKRLELIRRLVDAGIPTGVLVAPVIPVLTDHEIESILEAAAYAGAHSAGYVLLRLPLEVKDLFKEWLAEHKPLSAQHVMSLIRQSRQGRENDTVFGRRKRGTGVYADLISKRFQVATRKLGLPHVLAALDVRQFVAPGSMAADRLNSSHQKPGISSDHQLSLFE